MSRIHQSVIDLVSTRYDIVDILNLEQYDADPEALAKYLLNYANMNWSSKQRLVVLHHETDYYPTLDSIGNIMYNLLRLCANFSIPTDHIILFTNHYDITDLIAESSLEILNEKGPLVIETSLWYDLPEYDIPRLLEDTKHTKLYVCLNGQERLHRIFLLCALTDAGLIDQGMVSYHFENCDAARTS